MQKGLKFFVYLSFFVFIFPVLFCVVVVELFQNFTREFDLFIKTFEFIFNFLFIIGGGFLFFPLFYFLMSFSSSGIMQFIHTVEIYMQTFCWFREFRNFNVLQTYINCILRSFNFCFENNIKKKNQEKEVLCSVE